MGIASPDPHTEVADPREETPETLLRAYRHAHGEGNYAGLATEAAKRCPDLTYEAILAAIYRIEKERPQENPDLSRCSNEYRKTSSRMARPPVAERTSATDAPQKYR